MIKSIRSKFTIAFILVGLIGTLLVVVTLLLQIRAALDRFVMNQFQQFVAPPMMTYYQEHGDSWNGVESLLADTLSLKDDKLATVLGLRSEVIPYILIGSDHKVISSTVADVPVGMTMSPLALYNAIPLELDGKSIGWIQLTFFGGNSSNSSYSSSSDVFFKSIQRTILISAAGAVLVAVILGIMLAFTMTRTLREITEATEEIAQGKLGRQVKVRTNDEVGRLAASFNKMS